MARSTGRCKTEVKPRAGAPYPFFDDQHGYAGGNRVTDLSRIRGTRSTRKDTRGHEGARNRVQETDQALTTLLQRARPMSAVWIGKLGLFLLIGLMVLKPF